MNVDGHPGRIKRFEHCGCKAWVQKSVSGKFRVIANWCRDRLCPLCGRRRSSTAARLIDALCSGKDVRFVTLTLRHTLTLDLGQQIDRLQECFRRLRQRKFWSAHVTGGVGTIECKRSDDGSWHVHMHILISGTYMAQRELSADWLAVTGDSPIVDIRKPRGSTDRPSWYVAKYIGKPADGHTLSMPGSLDALVIALKGRRTLIRFGDWHADPDREQTDDDDVWFDYQPLDNVATAAACGDQNAIAILKTLGDRSYELLERFSHTLRTQRIRPPSGPAG